MWFNRKASSNTGNNVLPENKGQALTHRSENNQGDNTWQMTVPERGVGRWPRSHFIIHSAGRVSLEELEKTALSKSKTIFLLSLFSYTYKV